MRRAVVILTVRPSVIWMDFLSTFTEYDLFIVCDCNKYDYHTVWRISYPKIRFIQIPASVAADAGFSNLSTAVSPSQIVNAWDKAVYYFSRDQTYGHVWFIEEDVYFHDEKTILDIDRQYDAVDLLCSPITSKDHDRESPWFWHWPQIQISLPEPHYRAMMCAIRVSRNLLSSLARYAERYNTLFFLEALFPTVAKYHGLRCVEPTELSTVRYQHDWAIQDLDKIHLYHPMKNLIEQRDARTIERFFHLSGLNLKV